VDPFEAVAAGNTFLVEAPPGYGKSTLLRRIREQIEGRGESVATLAPTNVAARRVEGMTVHRHLLDKLRADWLLIDEYSMLSPDLCAALEHQRCRIILFGDRLQLLPVVNMWRGQPCAHLHESRLLGLWAGFREVRLTTPRRCQSRFFGKWLREARLFGLRDQALQMFPATGREAEWTLCLSNYRRQQVNLRRQLSEAGARGAVCHMRLEGRAVPVFVGTRLVAANTNKRFVNGGLLEFLGEGGEGGYALRDLDLGTAFETTQKQIERRCRLGWALTIAGSQSQTLQGVVRVCDLLSQHFNGTHLYVAASRATDPALLECLP
jgi:ATP-dependent exoDNAse (exonuclease V) alpha subunit